MSSFLAELKIEEVTLKVLECKFEYNVKTDETGFQSQRALPGNLNITIESTNKLDFVAWMLQDEMKDGEIVFFKRDMMSSAKTVSFAQAFCIHYSEIFTSEGDIPMKTNIVLSVYELAVDSTCIIQNWSIE